MDMVYEVKCSQCGDVLDFGGREPSGGDNIPEDAIEFDGEVYCRDCVSELIDFGIEDLEERVDFLENRLGDVLEAMGMEEE